MASAGPSDAVSSGSIASTGAGVLEPGAIQLDSALSGRENGMRRSAASTVTGANRPWEAIMSKFRSREAAKLHDCRWNQAAVWPGLNKYSKTNHNWLRFVTLQNQ
jgi:hypothetical protein